MSRSYKRNTIIKDNGKSKKIAKRYANHAVRRKNKELLKGSNYKKMYCSWNIADYISRWPIEEAIDDWYREETEDYKGYAWRHEQYGTLERWLNYWAKCVKRK